MWVRKLEDAGCVVRSERGSVGDEWWCVDRIRGYGSDDVEEEGEEKGIKLHCEHERSRIMQGRIAKRGTSMDSSR